MKSQKKMITLNFFIQAFDAAIQLAKRKNGLCAGPLAGHVLN